jgi:hypothetical protein
LGVLLATFVVVSSILLVEVIKLRDEVSAIREELSVLKRMSGEYSYNSDWATRFVGYYPVGSAAEAKELYLLLVNKAPKRDYWIIYFPEDNELPLNLEALEADNHYKVNGTFRNYAVNCPNARLTIVYNVFKNGTANLDNIKTLCSESVYQVYP